MPVVATAGHVDHGKSTIVRSLTGTDPDRLAEERRRGLTIDLGFAHYVIPSGEVVSFVDVPGHARFLRNMLAGIGPVDACLFVVAATEGWKPQSEEHLRICELLAVANGVIALSHAASVDPGQLARVEGEIRDHVAETFLAGAPIVAVDVPAGVGLDALRSSIETMVSGLPEVLDRGRPRLWVDRSFSIRGTGAVVTGTLGDGALRLDDVLISHGPTRTLAGARIRGLQSAGSELVQASPGERVALNVGTSHQNFARGDVLVRANDWHATKMVDASLHVLEGLDHPVTRRGAYLCYIGTREMAIRIRLLVQQELEPGADGYARLHLPGPVPLVPGDRYLLRESGRGETIGGGEILDVDPVLPAARATPSRSLERLVRERGWVEAGELARLSGELPKATIGRWVVDPLVLDAIHKDLVQRVDAAGPAGLELAALDERTRAAASACRLVRFELGRVLPRTTGQDLDPIEQEPWLAELDRLPFAPPTPDEWRVSPGLVRLLVQRGLVAKCGPMYFSPRALDRVASVVGELLEGAPEGVTVAAVRDRLGTSRRYVLALLAELDARAITRRRGEVRVAGPRLPTVAGDHPPGT